MNLYRWFSKTYRKTKIRSRKSWVFASGEKNGTVALPCSCKPRQIRHFDMFHFLSEVYIWKAAWLISVNAQFWWVGALSQLLKKMLICILEQRQHFPPLHSVCLRQKPIMLQSLCGCVVFLSGSLRPCCSNCRRDGGSSFPREPCHSVLFVLALGGSGRAGLCRALGRWWCSTSIPCGMHWTGQCPAGWDWEHWEREQGRCSRRGTRCCRTLLCSDALGVDFSSSQDCNCINSAGLGGAKACVCLWA